MNKLVDNLLEKFDQLKRKVMTEPETEENKSQELADNSDSLEKPAELEEKSETVQPEKKEARKPRPRRKNTKPRAKKSGSGPQETGKKAPKQTQKSQSENGGQKTEKTEKEPVIKLLINAEEPEECRIALIEDGKVESFHVTTVVHEQTKSNIYKKNPTITLNKIKQ